VKNHDFTPKTLLTKICMLDIDLHVLNLVDLDSFIGTKNDYSYHN
jgi:hypothetical protein